MEVKSASADPCSEVTNSHQIFVMILCKLAWKFAYETRRFLMHAGMRRVWAAGAGGGGGEGERRAVG